MLYFHSADLSSACLLLELDPAATLTASGRKLLKQQVSQLSSTTSQVRGSRVLCNGGGAESTVQIAANGTEIAQLLSPFSMHPTSFERTRCFLENLEPLIHSSFTAHPVYTPLSPSLFFFSCLLLSFSPLEESMCWYSFTSRCIVSHCFSLWGTLRGLHVPWYTPNPAFCCFMLMLRSLLFVFCHSAQVPCLLFPCTFLMSFGG